MEREMEREMRDMNGLTEAEYMANYNPDNWRKPSVTADVVIVNELGEVLLVRRGGHPFIGLWAIPGGFSSYGERIEETAARELLEETNLSGISLRIIGVYSKPGRDPRDWTMTAAYLGRVHKSDVKPKAGDDAAKAAWWKIDPEMRTLRSEETLLHFEDLAFDHNDILDDVLKML